MEKKQSVMDPAIPEQITRLGKNDLNELFSVVHWQLTSKRRELLPSSPRRNEGISMATDLAEEGTRKLSSCCSFINA